MGQEPSVDALSLKVRGRKMGSKWWENAGKLFARLCLLMLPDAILPLYCGPSGGNFVCTFTLCLYVQ